jgi:cysteine-rich repeat protein
MWSLIHSQRPADATSRGMAMGRDHILGELEAAPHFARVQAYQDQQCDDGNQVDTDGCTSQWSEQVGRQAGAHRLGVPRRHRR